MGGACSGRGLQWEEPVILFPLNDTFLLWKSSQLMDSGWKRLLLSLASLVAPPPPAVATSRLMSSVSSVASASASDEDLSAILGLACWRRGGNRRG